jgi:two-component system sensor histidine kinase/response regulator
MMAPMGEKTNERDNERGGAQMQARVKCLLVDDLEENLLALSALLRRDDVEVLTARSGPEALELLLVHDVALAFLDVQMPEMDGFELAELIRGSERTRHVPLIFVTAGGGDRHRLFKGYDSGAVDFLYKPIEPRVLKSKADVFFELYRSKQRLAQELNERTQTLRLNEMFSAALGHDLRNPLSTIVTSAHLIQLKTKDDGVREAAARILTSSKWMSRMIADILDLARARLAGGIPVHRAPTDLKSLVQRVTQEQRDACPGCRIELVWEGDMQGRWDADRLTQVASNLIGNAFQHGRADVTIQVRLDGTQPEAVTLAVTNAGHIPAELLPHIFDPFRGSSQQFGRHEGLGLGLYIVQQIVQSHHGSIQVQTSAEAGLTTFTVSFPRDVAPGS